MNKKGLSLVLLIITCSLLHSDGRNNTDSLKLYFTEYKLDLPGINEIFSAKWSPTGDKILISAAYYDSSMYVYSNFKFFIVNVKKKRISKFVYYLTKVFFPSTHRDLLTGVREILTLSSVSESLRSIATLVGDSFWLNDNTFLFEGTKSIENKGECYYVFKFNIPLKKSILIFKSFETVIILDKLQNELLISKPPEGWFHCHANPNNIGILSLHRINVNKSSTPLNLTPSPSPDTIIGLSEIFAARFLPNDRIIYQVNVIEHPDTGIIRKFEVLDLNTGEIRLLKRFREYEWFQFLQFAVSPSGEWLIYPTYNGRLEFLSIKQGTSRKIVLLEDDGDPFELFPSCQEVPYDVLDWCPDGDRILCVGERTVKQWDGYRWNVTTEEKLFLMKVPEIIKKN